MRVQDNLAIMKEFEKIQEHYGKHNVDWFMVVEDTTAIMGAFTVSKDINLQDKAVGALRCIQRLKKKYKKATVIDSVGSKGAFFSIDLGEE
jgi:hypothetical protein